MIVDRLVAASIAVSRMSEAGADRGALARQLLQPEARPEARPGSSVDDDPDPVIADVRRNLSGPAAGQP